jgi:transcriptional regulator with XRE-family HTH domain
MTERSYRPKGDYLRQLREARGWNLKELSRRMGVAEGSPGRWERGQGIRRKELYRLAEVFGVPPADLIDSDDTEAEGKQNT